MPPRRSLFLWCWRGRRMKANISSPFGAMHYLNGPDYVSESSRLGIGPVCETCKAAFMYRTVFDSLVPLSGFKVARSRLMRNTMLPSWVMLLYSMTFSVFTTRRTTIDPLPYELPGSPAEDALSAPLVIMTRGPVFSGAFGSHDTFSWATKKESGSLAMTHQ